MIIFPNGNSASGGGVAVVTPKTLYVTSIGNDTTGDGSLGAPYLTADKAFEVALAGSGDYVLQFGVGSFGTIIPSGDWPARITIRGAGYKVSRLTGINAAGAYGANATGMNGQNGGNGTAGKSLTIRSDQSINLGDITTNGGTGGEADAWGTAPAMNSGTPGAAGGNGGNGAEAGTIDLIGCVHEGISAISGSGGTGGEGQTGASTDDGSQAANGGVGGNAGTSAALAGISLLNCYQIGASKSVSSAEGLAKLAGAGGAGGTDTLNNALNGSAGAAGIAGANGATSATSSFIKSILNDLSVETNVTAHSCFYVADNGLDEMANGINNFALTETQLGMI